MFREKEPCFISIRKWAIWARDGFLYVPTADTKVAMKIWKRVLKVRKIIVDMKYSVESPVLMKLRRCRRS